ncbi:MAG: DinB family protein [Longimicrobiales bacterium]
MNTSSAFLTESRRYLMEEYLPKIGRSLEGLPPEDIWWRPNPESNSIGNLLLHLAGNARQWVVAGIGEQPDLRRRQEEFDEVGGRTGPELLAYLQETLEEVDGVLSGLPESRLEEERVIQGFTVTILQAIYHVVEHFSMHTGQIIYLSKLRCGKDLGFYQVQEGGVKRMW